MSLSGTWAAGTTLAESPFGDTGPTDWLGFGKEYRALPTPLADASAKNAIKPGGIFSDDGYSADELESFGEMIEPVGPLAAEPAAGLRAVGDGRGADPVGTVELGPRRVGVLERLEPRRGVPGPVQRERQRARGEAADELRGDREPEYGSGRRWPSGSPGSTGSWTRRPC